MAVIIKTPNQIELMSQAGSVVAKVLDKVAQNCKSGVSTYYLNKIANRELRENGALSSFLGYSPHPGAVPYPAVICASVNSVVVHGIPNKDIILADGDIIGIDFACHKDGWCADAAITVGVGEISTERKKIIQATKECLDMAIEKCVIGNTLGDIGHTIYEHAKKNSFDVVKTFSGHGIGKSMHEEPSVFNIGNPGAGMKLEEGMVIAIEPMLTAGTDEVFIDSDKWTVKTKDGHDSAHFEHSVAITQNGPKILTVI
jgi:methionyl aminopeptidase